MVLRVNADLPRRVLLDAGPLIGAFNARDTFHLESSRGLAQLADAHVRVLVPVAVVFEVYKWLAYHSNMQVARTALVSMRLSFDLLDTNRAMVDELSDLVNSMPWWAGSLEDALLALLATRLDAPLWTFNYRDFTGFHDLPFWNPRLR
jgi:predicted nucleic acid-binding protein